ncbi:MAG: TrmH family RNA methyltransferase [Myxococcota bacterium]
MSRQRPTVVLVRPAGALNVGLVARACANFDASLRLVGCTADLRSVEFRMTSVHAERVVARIERFDALDDAIADLDWVVGTCGAPRDPRLPVLAPRDLAPQAALRQVGRLGIVFGNEAHGLANDELAACAAYVTIPADPAQPSLNLSHAVAVMLATLYFDLSPQDASSPVEAAPRSELDALRETCLELARDSGYFERASETRLPASLDRMFRRWVMLRGDVRTMMGLLRHVRDRLRSG